MYVRFVLPRKNADSGVSDGVFKAAYSLQRSGILAAHEDDEISALLDWFDDHLERPTRFNRTKSKGYVHRAAKGISWFKPTATDHIHRMRRLIVLLEEHGHRVTMLKTRNPGYVVYEDDHQVVAEPFSDTKA